MIVGTLIGVGITFYIFGASFYLFAAARAGEPLFGIFLGLFWPILIPYFWFRSKIERRRWTKEGEK